MFEKWRQVPEVYISGGFDLLHPDHTEFIRRCVKNARDQHTIDTVVFGLLSDQFLAQKSPHRPFFTFAWRAEDVKRAATSLGLGFEVQVEHASPPDSRKNRRRVLAFSSEYYKRPMIEDARSTGARLIFAQPVNNIHTTDVEKALLTARNEAHCDIRQVGAVMLRDGVIQAIGKNGGETRTSCASCSKCKDFQGQLQAYGRLQTPLVPCDYEHAEQQCLQEAEPGDWLLTTTSPCEMCTDEIIAKDLARVVYLEAYHNTNPLKRMEDQGIQVRQAGYRK